MGMALLQKAGKFLGVLHVSTFDLERLQFSNPFTIVRRWIRGVRFRLLHVEENFYLHVPDLAGTQLNCQRVACLPRLSSMSSVL